MVMTRTHIRKVIGAVALTAAASAGLVACGTESAQADEPTATGPVKTAQTDDLGVIVVDAEGKTVYAFEGDTADTSACLDACLKNWPIVVASDTPAASPAGIDAQLGVFTRSDGSRQLTLDGHQLYTFVKDAEAGQHNGMGKKLGDFRWGVLPADGDPRY
jgi:predicted lipoprotein with Yx(FWY)xxD motif